MIVLRFFLPYTKHTDLTLTTCQGRNQRHLFEEITTPKVTCVHICTSSGLAQLLEKVWLGSVGRDCRDILFSKYLSLGEACPSETCDFTRSPTLEYD